MTPAAFKYIGRLYESFVDRSLDVGQIGVELMRKHGIRRTPYQISHDLDTVFAFAGYAASHAPAPAMTVKQWDAAISTA